MLSFGTLRSGDLVWGPAAFAQDAGETRPKSRSRTVKSKKIKAKVSQKSAVKNESAKAPIEKKLIEKTALETKKPQQADDLDAYELDDDNARPVMVSMGSSEPQQRGSNARELAVRVVGVAKISVLPAARQYVPKDLELRLAERLVQELASKTYFDPQAIDGVFDLRSSPAVIAEACEKASVDGLLVFQIGVEQIEGYLASMSGRRVRIFDFRYRVGELEEANAVSVLTERIVEGVVRSIPYRGFVTSSGKDGTAIVNLGSNHGVKEGHLLELFEFRRLDFNSTHKMLMQVEVTKVLGPTESQVEVLESASKNARIEPYSKISYSLSKVPTVAATDHSVVSGSWWFQVGGELNSFSAEAAAQKYESRVFKINGAPFGYISGGNDALTIRAAFGSGRSDSETLSFFDLQSTYTIYQFGGAQSAWSIGAGGRAFLVNVRPNLGATSALESTVLVSPMAELKYRYVPRGRIRLNGIVEVFWPIYTTGAQVGALIFAFGGGAGAGLEIAVSDKFGVEVFGKLRYLRRPVEGQNGVQERQSVLGAGLLFSF